MKFLEPTVSSQTGKDQSSVFDFVTFRGKRMK